MVIEGEVLNDFLRFFGIPIAEFAVDGAVNLALKMKGDMIIKNLDLKPKIDAMMRDFLESCADVVAFACVIVSLLWRQLLEAIQPDAYHKLCEAGPQKWSRAHCPLIRYNYMTSNSVESINACTVLKRKLIMLAEMYRVMVQEWYFKLREVAGSSL
ncbi:hypothetical protein Tco_0693150 [Tanacetum coccineum]